MSVLVRARGLGRTYPGPRTALFTPRPVTRALVDVDIDVDEGSALGIIGESGSGKSTLVRILLGLDRATTGTVSFAGRPVDAAASARRLHWLRRETGIVFQDPYASLDPRMSVGRIIAEPLWALGIEGDRRSRVAEVLVDVGLDADAATRYPHEFSGGQRQRIGIARALAMRPDVLVADEAVSALDVSVQAEILKLLKGLQEEFGLAILFITHDLRVAAQICDRVAVMQKGRIVEMAETAQLFAHPRDAYTRQLLAAVPGMHTMI
jgi:peptide/nickel transport system ATP-binding protein